MGGSIDSLLRRRYYIMPDFYGDYILVKMCQFRGCKTGIISFFNDGPMLIYNN